MTRPTCSVFIAVSVDGYIARADGAIDWLASMERPGEDYGYAAFFGGVDALVLGRGTYDTVRGFQDWPYAGKRCVVMTHRPAPPRADETFYEGPPGPLLDQLASEGVRRVYVDGGQVIRQFLAEGLVEELTLSIVPVLLGNGIRLFDAGVPERPLTLVESRAFPSGLTQVRYRIAA